MWSAAISCRTAGQPTLPLHEITITAPISASRSAPSETASGEADGRGEATDSTSLGAGGWPIKTSAASTATTSTRPTRAGNLPRFNAASV